MVPPSIDQCCILQFSILKLEEVNPRFVDYTYATVFFCFLSIFAKVMLAVSIRDRNKLISLSKRVDCRMYDRIVQLR